MLRCINALEPIQRGSITIDGQPIHRKSKNLTQLRQQGKKMIIVIHEMQFARAVADRVIFLAGGKIVEEADPEIFFDHPKTERAKQFLNVFTFEQVKHKDIDESDNCLSEKPN